MTNIENFGLELLNMKFLFTIDIFIVTVPSLTLDVPLSLR
jgi:hypothetical protein